MGALEMGTPLPPLDGGLEAPNVGLLVDPGTPVLVGIDGVNVPIPSPSVGDAVAVGVVGEGSIVRPLNGGLETPNVGLVVDPGTPVLMGIDGVPVLSPIAGVSVVPGSNVPVLPFAGDGVVPGGNETPNVGLVVDPGTPVLVVIDGVPVP